MSVVTYRVSDRGQMALPAETRRRWNLTEGGAVDVVDLGEAVLRILLDDEPSALRTAGTNVFTTGLWYHRLCRALNDHAVVGSMSRRLGDVDDSVAAQVVGAVIELPDSIDMVSLRSLGWPMGELVGAGARLNLLSLEAVAAERSNADQGHLSPNTVCSASSIPQSSSRVR